MPGSVLFICQGNMYRSPFAAKLFSRQLPAGLRDRVTVFSAGFEAPGRPCPEFATMVAAEQNVDLAEHRSSLVSAELVREADLVVVMDPRHGEALSRRFPLQRDRVVVLGDFDPATPDSRVITDPVGRPPEVLRESYDRIARCTRALVKVIVAGAGSSV